LPQALRASAPIEGAIEDKNLPASLEEIAREKGVNPSAIEVWTAYEARIARRRKSLKFSQPHQH
jgi:hypothetical protein